MSGAVTVSDEGIVTGNTYDKYGSTNPVVRRLMSAFERTLDELFEQADPSSADLRRASGLIERTLDYLARSGHETQSGPGPVGQAE